MDETTKTTPGPLSPKPVRQRERSGVETDDDDLLAHIQRAMDGTSGVSQEELLKEKIIEARLIARCKHSLLMFRHPYSSLLVKTIYNSFMNEKENLAKLEQQMNEKPLDLSNITPVMTTTSADHETPSSQTVDILQELLNTIKLNNQLEVRDRNWQNNSSLQHFLYFRQKSKRLNVISKMKMNVLKNYALTYVSEDYRAKSIFKPTRIHFTRRQIHLFK